MANAEDCSSEVRKRAAGRLCEHGCERSSQWAAIMSITGKVMCVSEALHTQMLQTENRIARLPDKQ